MIKRTELLVFFNYRSSVQSYLDSLKVDVQYLNKKLGYAVLYLDEDNLKKVTESLKRMKGFKKYEVSPTKLVDLDI